jgi:putative glutamine amidotransferase
MTRPLVAVPARFAARASALRYRAEVAARALVEAVYRAGGEPWVMHPDAADAERRLARAAALLLPGGGDLAPHRYGATAVHETTYDIDDEQDAFDLAAARYALAGGLPTLAVCRGLQVVNVALGGTLRQAMECAHRHVVHPVALASDSTLARARGGAKVDASCYHHQCVDRLGDGLRPVAWAADGTLEAVELTAPRGWFVAVQWHPEDAPDQWLFDAFVAAAS